MRFSSGCITSALAIIVAAAPLSAQAFEGRITFKVSSENGSSREMQYQVKDNKVRFEMPGGRRTVAWRWSWIPGNQKMLMMMPAQKMYMEQTFAPTPSTRPRSRRAGAPR